jgi:peptidyl-prolyl cis-trans isomerase A (cyclophilin A)
MTRFYQKPRPPLGGGASDVAKTILAVWVIALPLSCTGGGDEARDARLQNPLLRASQFNEAAPQLFQARLETTAGAFVIEVHRDWAPLGADRFYNLVKRGWYDGVRFHRVLEDFTAGWGIHDDPYVNFVWQKELLLDDPVTQSNTLGRVSFARSGPNSRTTQVFINLKDNTSLDDRFAPFGEVVEGMDVVEGLYADYGDGPPRGEGVYQAMALARGAEYFDVEFPELDRIDQATIPTP